jgi:hypothetical protein
MFWHGLLYGSNDVHSEVSLKLQRLMYNSVHQILKFLDSAFFGSPSHDYGDRPVLLLVSEVK